MKKNFGVEKKETINNKKTGIKKQKTKNKKTKNKKQKIKNKKFSFIKFKKKKKQKMEKNLEKTLFYNHQSIKVKVFLTSSDELKY